MPFDPDVKTRMFIRCNRLCCLCLKSCGTNIEAAHIIDEAAGGSNDFDNGIPLCFDCHQEIGSYNVNHPRGNKFRPEELRARRDRVYTLVEQAQIADLRAVNPTQLSEWPLEPHRSMTGSEVERLIDALCEAFPPPFELEMLLRLRLNKRLDDIAHPAPGCHMVFQVVKAAEREGWLQDLVRAACDYTPTRPAMNLFSREFGYVAPSSAGAPRGSTDWSAFRSRLLVARGRGSILRLKFEVEERLSRDPYSVEGRLLLEEIERLLPLVAACTPPIVSRIDDQTTLVNTPTAAIPFTVADYTILATELKLTAESDNQVLVPDANILIVGECFDRTLTIIPATDQSGRARISVTAQNNAGATTSLSFTLTVGPT